MAWTPDQPIVSIVDVHKSFHGVEVLSGISLDIDKCGVACIIGPSGSGKSTLLRCINALVPIDRGSIRVEGQEVNDPPQGCPFYTRCHRKLGRICEDTVQPDQQLSGGHRIACHIPAVELARIEPVMTADAVTSSA